jgi:hypothetical protein
MVRGVMRGVVCTEVATTDYRLSVGKKKRRNALADPVMRVTT